MTDRVFVTLPRATARLRLRNASRRSIRATLPVRPASRDGLLVQSFRNDTPYQGEDLLYEPSGPERFFVRCTRKTGPTPGICLHEQRIANTDITVRFPRDWLADWQDMASGIDRLIASLLPDNSK
jgi:hypothetical protein